MIVLTVVSYRTRTDPFQLSAVTGALLTVK